MAQQIPSLGLKRWGFIHQTIAHLTRSYITEILKRQASDGWLGPDSDRADFWSRYPFLLAVVQAHEAMPQ
eukprot:1471346-Amphidinium_carterae.1